MPQHIKTLAKVIPRNESRRWRNARRRTSTTPETNQKTNFYLKSTENMAESAVETVTTTLATLRISAREHSDTTYRRCISYAL